VLDAIAISLHREGREFEGGISHAYQPSRLTRFGWASRSCASNEGLSRRIAWRGRRTDKSPRTRPGQVGAREPRKAVSPKSLTDFRLSW